MAIKGELEMVSIKKYKHNKSGKEFYSFQAHIGVDPYTGKNIRVSRRKDSKGRRFKTKKEAELEINRLRLNFKESRPSNIKSPKIINTIITFEDLFFVWWEKRYKGTVKESTLLSTRRIFRLKILPVFGDLKWEKVDKYICESLIDKLIKFDNAQISIWITYIKRIFEYAVYLDIIDTNYMKIAYIPKKKIKTIKNKNKRHREILFYEKEELNEFLECSQHYGNNAFWHTLFHLIAYTGIRVGECLALKWEYVNFNNRTILIKDNLIETEYRLDEEINKNFEKPTKKQLTVSTTKNNTEVYLSLDDKTIDLLKKWRKKQRVIKLKQGYNTMHPDQLIFSNRKNSYLDLRQPNKAMNRICKKNGLRILNVHGLRHTHCSLLFEAGASVAQVQERMRHQNPEITLKIYKHVTNTMKKDTATIFKEHLENN